MLHFSILTTRPSSLSFSKMLPFFTVYLMGMKDIFLVRNKLKIFQPVIGSV